MSVRFSNPRLDESHKLFVPFNFDVDDPVQVFTRVREVSPPRRSAKRGV
jgi:hypothetical protein